MSQKAAKVQGRGHNSRVLTDTGHDFMTMAGTAKLSQARQTMQAAATVTPPKQ